MKVVWRILTVLALVAGVGYLYWKFAIPTHHVAVRSRLVMLGDLDGDHRWTGRDLDLTEQFRRDPFASPDALACLLDLNQNSLNDEEDVTLLKALVEAGGDPYAAQDAAGDRTFPRAREFYRYVPEDAYRPRPLWALPYPPARDSILSWLEETPPSAGWANYEESLSAAVYAEAVRFDQGWRKRERTLLPLERAYASKKIERLHELYQSGDRYELLLALIELVEDAETLSVKGQPDFTIKLLAFRDHLRETLQSPVYAEFKAGREDWRRVLGIVAGYLRSDLGLSYDFETLAPPRNFTDLQNYLDRAEWQYYKSTTREQDFRALIEYAQHDARYLRAVSRTSPRFQDPNVENHNLPMVLLFREALRIKGGDKKKAIGLLDESIRIPYAWVKSIPREALPGSLALDNFLLPGNKEDGADKSRHWNVFGGICIYKTPQEALDLSLKREMKDLREAHYSERGTDEFFRDMIANLNGMYHVISVDPTLIAPEAPATR